MFETMQTTILQSTETMLADTGQKLVSTVPLIILAFIVLILGVIVARYVRKFVLHLAELIALDKLSVKVNLDHFMKLAGLDMSISRLIGLLVYWLLILFAFLLASEILHLDAVSQAIGEIVGYIPHLIAALIIVVIGLLVGRFLRDVVSTSLARADVAGAPVLGYMVQVVIVFFVCILAVGQLGFDVSVLTTHMAVILATLLISAGVACAVAIRPFLENVFICQQVRNHLKMGDTVELSDLKGNIVAFSLTSVVINDGETDVIVPARELFEQRFRRTRAR